MRPRSLLHKNRDQRRECGETSGPCRERIGSRQSGLPNRGAQQVAPRSTQGIDPQNTQRNNRDWKDQDESESETTGERARERLSFHSPVKKNCEPHTKKQSEVKSDP